MPASKIDIILQAYDKMTAPINAAVSKAQAKLSSFAEKTDKLANKAYHSGKEMTVAGFAVAAPLYKAFEAASEFETKMVDIGKQLNANTPQEYASKMANMTKQVMALGHELPLATGDIQEMIAASLRMGIAEDKVVGFTKEVTKMAVAFDMPAGEIADSMGKLANVFKIPVDQIGGFADAINYLDDKTVAKGPEIIDVLQRIGGSAKALEANDAAALASTMLSLGESSSTAGTGINAMLNRLGAATMQSKRFQEGMHMLGLSSADIQKKMSDKSTAKTAILEVFKKIQGLKPEKQTEALVRLFGAEHGPKLAKLANNVEAFRKQLEMVQGAQKGSMDKEYQRRIETSAAQMQIFKNRINDLWVKIGTNLLPTVNQIIIKVGVWIDKVGKFIDKHPQLVKWILKAAIGFSALALAGGYLSFVVSGVARLFNIFTVAGKGPLKVIGWLTDKKKGLSHWIFVVRYRMLQFSDFITNKALPAITKFGRFLSSNLIKGIRLVGQSAMWLGRVLMANPIILIVTAIAVAAFLIYKYWGPIKEFFINIWNKIKGYVTPVINFLKNLFLNFTPIGWIIKLWKPITGLVKAIFRLVMAIIGLFFRIAKWLFLNFTPIGWVIKYWGPISTFFKDLWNGIVKFFKGIWEGIKSMFQAAAKWVYDKTIGPFNKIKNWISQKWAQITGIFRSVWNSVKAAFAAAGNWIYDNTIGRLIKLKDALFDAGKNIIKAIGDGIKAGIKWVTDAIDSATQAIRDFFPFSPPKTGPLVDIDKSGGKLLKTFAGGVDTSKNNDITKRLRQSLEPVNAMLQPNNSPNLALQGISPARENNSNFNLTINLSGGATKNDAKMIGDIVIQKMKEYNNQKARVGFA